MPPSLSEVSERRRPDRVSVTTPTHDDRSPRTRVVPTPCPVGNGRRLSREVDPPTCRTQSPDRSEARGSIPGEPRRWSPYRGVVQTPECGPSTSHPCRREQWTTPTRRNLVGRTSPAIESGQLCLIGRGVARERPADVCQSNRCRQRPREGPEGASCQGALEAPKSLLT